MERLILPPIPINASSAVATPLQAVDRDVFVARRTA
jgi:hypothetical protein